MSSASKLAFAFLVLGPLGGCVPAYQPPAPEEPHAVLKVRRTYETKAGTLLTERVLVDEHLAFDAEHATRAVPVAETSAVLIHPTTAKVTMHATFSHQEMKRVMERYSEQKPYTDRQSYNCGSGTSYRTCYRSVTRYRTEYKTRYVTRNVTVVDGSCERAFYVAPREGGTYLAQFTYQDHGACALSCFEQASKGRGKFEQRACPSAPEPKE